MKKNLLNVLLLAVPFTGIAQPTITSYEIVPQIGDVYINHTTSFESPGSAGANVTWDFSNLASQGTSNSTYVSPVGTPYANNFPTADIATSNNGAYGYFDVSSSAFSIVGQYAGTLFNFSDPEALYHFPLTHTSSYTDDHQSTFTNGAAFTRHGTTTLTGDGYGTLITPAGTFPNAVRAKLVQDYQDDYSGGTINYMNTVYLWFAVGYKGILLSFTDFESDFQDLQYGLYADESVGFGENDAEELAFNVYPNPANDAATIELMLDGNETVEVSIYNSMGALVANTQASGLSTGVNRLPLDLAGLSKGIYHVHVMAGNKMATRIISKL